MDPDRIVVLAGGVGGALFVRGLRAVARRTPVRSGVMGVVGLWGVVV